MSENNNKRKKKKKKNRITFGKVIKIFLVLILMIAIISGVAVAGMVLSILKDAPEIDPTKVNASLDHTSSIYDSEGNLLEKIDAAEFRTFVELNKIPKHLQDAFIAIEDERFKDHHGVDPKGIVSSAMENIKAGKTIRGASTITQQLVKNVYLDPDKTWSRKITEAYLALQVERVLHKDQILEAYLNRNFFGQNAYGVQEAAQTYFSKDVGELTIAESALLAGVVKSTNQFQPYLRIKPENFDSNVHDQIGEADILGEKYILVFNEESISRQKLVLKKMLDLEKINQVQYDEALKEDIKANLNPGKKKRTDITSYFSDYVKSETIKTLMSQLNYSKEEAEEMLFAGGLKIYSTIDVALQKELENVYENFTDILVENVNNVRAPVLIDWRLDGGKNIIDDTNNIIFYHQDNLLNQEMDLIIEKDSYHIKENGDIVINNKKLTIYPKHIEITDYYRIDDKKSLITHTVGSIVIPEDEFLVGGNKELVIMKKYLDKAEDFYTIDENSNMIISRKYFYRSPDGIVQPQSASVILDYRSGHIKAVVGGRDIDGNRILNRATNSRRQPGSVIKPISVYLPALDNGYTAASAIDDIPFTQGSWSPRNWYTGYRGIQSLRKSVEQSVNINSIKTLENMGIKTSMSYLEKMGIIDNSNPENDSFVTNLEDKKKNDENLSALALGGMTKGLTPLEITAAFGTIANDGVFVEPIAFTKILDKDGNILINNVPKETTVVSPQTAYIMKDILRTTVTSGLAARSKLNNMAVAGKTGTTQHQADIWFVGFTPYYVSGVWVGNDSPKITLTKGSSTAAQLWQHIMTRAHDGLEGVTSFSKPTGIISANVCTQSGKLATTLCSSDPRGVVRSEIFAQGTVPNSYCDVHVQVHIDTSNGKLANEYCPRELVQSRVFIQRTPPYLPSEHGGIVPSDYQYNAPSSVCTDHNALTPVIESPEEDKDKDDDYLPQDPMNKDEEDKKDKDKDKDNDKKPSGEIERPTP